MWPSNLQNVIGINSVKHNCPNKGFELRGTLDFQIGLSRWKELVFKERGWNYVAFPINILGVRKAEILWQCTVHAILWCSWLKTSHASFRVCYLWLFQGCCFSNKEIGRLCYIIRLYPPLFCFILFVFPCFIILALVVLVLSFHLSKNPKLWWSWTRSWEFGTFKHML